MITYILRYPVESLATFATLIPIAALLYRLDFRKSIERYFFVYLISKLAIESIMLYMAANKQNNLYLYNALVLVSYCLLSRMCYESIDIRFHRRIILVGSALFLAVFAIDIAEVGMMQVTRYAPTLQCVLMIIYIMLFFYGLLQSLKVRNLFTYPVFWIFSGLLVYYCVSTFCTPILHYVERFGAPRDLYIVVLLPYAFESLYLTAVGVGVLLEE